MEYLLQEDRALCRTIEFLWGHIDRDGEEASVFTFDL